MGQVGGGPVGKNLSKNKVMVSEWLAFQPGGRYSPSKSVRLNEVSPSGLSEPVASDPTARAVG